VIATAGNTNATVSWTPPVNTGGRPITGFTVTSSPGGVTASVGGSTLSAAVGPLTNGTTYTFTVTATNIVGTSVASSPSNPVVPFVPTIPDPPINVTAVPGHGQATVSWSPPGRDGGRPITGYTVTSSPGGVITSVGPTTSAVVTPLSNGTPYTFTITATNAIGTSLPSTQSNAITPGTPTDPGGVMAVAGVGSATVYWTAPVDPGISPIVKYTILSSGGAVQTVPGNATSGLIAGLSAVPHTFVVIATNAVGDGLPSAISGSIDPVPGGTYHALTGQRLLDTRIGTGGVPVAPVAAGHTLNLQVSGRGGVPSTDVSAVLLNVTVTGTAGYGYVTVYPSGASLPLASNLNFVPGQTVPNLVEVAVGNNGMVSFYVGGASTHLVADVEGWVGDPTNSFGRDGLFVPLPPARLLDTRIGNGAPVGQLGAGQTLSLPVLGAEGPGGVPMTGVSAVVLNVTVTNPTAPSYLIVYPGGAAQPLASNLNFVAGQTVPNRVVVPVDGTGQIKIFNGMGSVDVIVDINGWFTDSSSTHGGSAFVASLPTRIFDSRTPGSGGPLGEGWMLTFDGGPNESAYVLNVTATNPSTAGFLTLFPDGAGYSGPPLASDLNFVQGQTVPNLCVVSTVFNQHFNVFNGIGTVDIVVDVDGYYSQAVPAPPLAAGFVLRMSERAPTKTLAPMIVKAPATQGGR
jgi:hypothetical protein